jgi:hypothetical protein
MMEYITRKQYFPGALSDAGAELLKKIYEAGVYFPSWVDMSKDEIAAFDELMPGYYVESCAYYGYRVKGTSYVDSVLSRVKQQVSQRNQTAFIREAFEALGIECSNIKSICPAPNGFAARSNRWCVTLHHSVRLSALQVNWTPGLSGAVWNGNVCTMLVGKE